MYQFSSLIGRSVSGRDTVGHTASADHAQLALGMLSALPSKSFPSLGTVSNSISLIDRSQHAIPELDDIVKYFNSLPLAQTNQTNHFDFERPGKPTLFVKYGDDDLLDEASTQSFFHALAQRDSSARTPCILAVYNAFCGEGYYFIIMEKINMPGVRLLQYRQFLRGRCWQLSWLSPA